jgi:peptide deformylase
MALLNILQFPDPRLRKKALPVQNFDENLKLFAENMIETMYKNEGIGLAAIQVNVTKRVITVDVSEEQNAPQVFVNPEITDKSGKTVHREGCLSVPEYYEEVQRAECITVQYQDVDGKKHELEADGILAICIQHEIDHLNGRLFVDYLSDIKRDKAIKLMKRISKERQQPATAD